ncbi:MAG: protein kinase [Thermoanaerobaculia bacterium]
MNENRWPEARALFEAALDLPQAERVAFVERRAGADSELLAEVRSLLESHAGAAGFLDGTDVGVLRGFDGSEAAEMPRERVGPWRIVRLLGEGGMGRVYLGERATGDYEQRVAIKVVSGGLANAEIVRRFGLERRILASLEHPGIARLLDGGTTEDGLPYFVMEYVEGSGILDFADQRRLSVRERVELFLEVCAAVAHAHQRLVVHRDLKPGNILVGADGRPKLLDFGIGKLLQSAEGGESGERTATRLRWLTPSYASPEQILGEPTTTATDVFGLGLVLFELLTGSKPHASAGSSPREVEAAILGQTPRRVSAAVQEAARGEAALRAASPRRLRRLLRGDLDNVVAKALEREPARRYATVGDLASDLGRYLRGEPVQARSASALERFHKLVLRHRAASIALLAGVVLLVGLTTYHTATLRRERNAAEREAANANEIASFLTRLFEGANRVQTGGVTLTARDLLERGEKQLEERTDLAPVIRARLLVTMALARESLGDLARAGELANRAVELHETAAAPAGERVYALLLKGHFLWKGGRQGEALSIFARADALAASDPTVPLATQAKVAMSLGDAYYETGDEPRARAAFERFVDLEKRLGSPARTGSALNNLGAIVANMGDVAGGRARYQESVAYFEQSSEKSAYEIYLPLYNLAELDLEAGDFASAERDVRRAMTVIQRVLGPDSRELLWGTAALAEAQRQRGDLEAARRTIERAFALRERLREPDAEDRSWVLRISGKIHLSAGDRPSAIADLERALAIERGLEGDRSDWIRPIEVALAEARGAASPPGPTPPAPESP